MKYSNRWRAVEREARKNYRFFRMLVKTPKRHHQPQRVFFKTQSIFIHIPKMAGTSVSQSLYAYGSCGHTPLARYQHTLPDWVLKRYFKFAFVRNPWDRLCSAYCFLSTEKVARTIEEWVARHLAGYASFEEFVCSSALEKPAIRKYKFFRPMCEYLMPQSCTQLPMDFIGFYENLAEDFDFIRQSLGIDVPLKYRKTTRMLAGKDYRDLYTGKMIDLVARFYAQDIRAFGYCFDNASLPTHLRQRSTRHFPHGFDC